MCRARSPLDPPMRCIVLHDISMPYLVQETLIDIHNYGAKSELLFLQREFETQDIEFSSMKIVLDY